MRIIACKEVQRLNATSNTLFSLSPPVFPRWRQSVEIARTAAWTLSNLARGDKTPAKPFLQVGIEVIAALQGTARGAPRDEALRVEASWILAFVTAKEDESVSALLRLNLVPALVQALVDSGGEVLTV